MPRPDRSFLSVRDRLRDPRTARQPLANWRTLVKWEASVRCASLPFLIIFLKIFLGRIHGTDSPGYNNIICARPGNHGDLRSIILE